MFGHLDGDGAVKLVVVGEIDSAEAAFSEQPDDPIAADPGRVAAGKRRWNAGRTSWVKRRGRSSILVHHWYRSRRRCRSSRWSHVYTSCNGSLLETILPESGRRRGTNSGRGELDCRAGVFSNGCPSCPML